MGSRLVRSRWAAIGAAVAVSLGGGGVLLVQAASGSQSSYVAVTPCRLFDTRPAPDKVGDRGTPLTTGEQWVRQVTGTNGNCTIPAGATGISYNLTVPDPPVTGFIKIYPADVAPPTASAINPVAGGGTKANSGIVGLSASGAIALFNQTGPINALLDITGYFVPASSGPAGPAGPTGPAGATGPRGVSAWDTIPSGQTVTGVFGTSGVFGASQVLEFSVNLPARAPVALTAANVNFAPGAPQSDDDATCTGSASNPTAPAGKVCIYPYGHANLSSFYGSASFNLPNQAFYVSAVATAFTDGYIWTTWAYTAP